MVQRIVHSVKTQINKKIECSLMFDFAIPACLK
jgi:hypothetical protein